jgi:hypothetical protein
MNKDVKALIIVFIIFIALLCIFILYNKNNFMESYEGAYNWKSHGTTPEINKSPPVYLQHVVANKNPYVDNLPLDAAKKLTTSIDNPFKAYNLGMLDYSKMTGPLISSEKNLKKFGDFKTLGLSSSELNEYNKSTNINRANEVNINEALHLPYISSTIEDINIINKDVLAKINKNQQLVVSKELIMKNGLHDFIIYNYRIKGVIVNNNNKRRYQLIINLIKEGSYYNPTIYVDALSKNNKVYIYECKYIGEYNTSEFLLVPGKDDNDNSAVIPVNYQEPDKIIQNIDTIIKERDEYAEEHKLTSQYACFNTDPSVVLGKAKLYNKSSPGGLKEFTMLNYFDREDCERVYDFLGKEKKRGVWDRPCRKNEDCPFYKGNKNYDNNFGECDAKTGKCSLPLNMQNVGYHYFYPEKQLEPLCYNCKSTKWLPITKLSKCCDEQNNKEKYPFLDGPDYVFNNDYHIRVNTYMQKNCKLKSVGKKNIDNNISCNKDAFNLF